MSLFNQTIHNHQTFTLIGIPGMPEKDFWMALPLCLLYSTTFLGNFIILVVIKVERSLHEPMYYFLAMLAATDLSLSLSSMPTMISVHLFDWRSVTLDVCITQMFFIHNFGGVESGVLVAMAFDRFVAIRFPLRYAAILSWSHHQNWSSSPATECECSAPCAFPHQKATFLPLQCPFPRILPPSGCHEACLC